jgi:hypothetical protein
MCPSAAASLRSRILLKVGSPARIAMRLPKASTQYFNFGDATSSMSGDRSMTATQRGVPEELALWMIWVVEGFAPVVLETAGARDVHVSVKSDSNPADRSDGSRTLI